MSTKLRSMVPLTYYLAGPPRNGFSPVESPHWTGVRLLGLGCLTQDGFVPQQLKNAPTSIGSKHFAILRDGDLLMSRANTRELVGLVGRYRDVGSPCIYPDLMMKLIPADNCLPDFLEAVLRSPSVRRSIQRSAQGTSESMVKISASSVKSLLVPYLPLGEQRKFVDLMDSVSESAKVADAALRKLKTARAAFVEERISASVEWGALRRWVERIEAGESPNLPSLPASPGGWGVLKVSAIGMGRFKPEENKRVDNAGLVNEKYRVLPGDLIIARASTSNLVGRTCMVTDSPFNLLLSDKTLRIVLRSREAIPQFVNICFGSHSVRRQVEGLSSGISQGMQNISQKAIEGIRLPLWDFEEQKRFASEVQAMDDRIAVEVARLAKARGLKSVLVDEMLSKS